MKFRAWDKVRDQWIHFTVGQVNDHTMKEVYNRLCIEGANFYQELPFIDETGKQAYVGHVVENLGKYLVLQDVYQVGYMIAECTLVEESFKIIGNIEQNPKLYDLDGKSTLDA